jgi:translation initiation factor IF-3
MSYLEKLIDRATDTSLNLENNRIGNYEITPQHGNVAVYHIYKYGAYKYASGRRDYSKKEHVCTITIDTARVDIEIDADYLTRKEISDIIDVINNLYDGKNINTKNI